MSEESRQRESICEFAKSIYDRGLTNGASGNISTRLSNGRLLLTPGGHSFGSLDPASISCFDENLKQVSGERPTKEMPLHQAFYETRADRASAVVHLHSTHSVAVSVLPDVDPDNVLPPITAYSIMRLGKVALLPYFMPGDAAAADAVRGLAGKRSALLLANHGPVVAGKDLEAAVFAVEELEEAARLTLLTRGLNPRLLTPGQIQHVVETFDVEWET